MWKRTGLAGCAVAVILAMATAVKAQTGAVPPAATPAAAAQSMSVDDLVAKHLATKGGADKWKTIQSQKMTGVAVAQGFQLALTIYARRPNQSRQELTIEVPGQPTTTIVNLFDGDKAWMINPMTGSSTPQAMPDSDTAIAKAQSDFDGALVDYKTKGYTVALAEPASVASKTAYHLKVTRADLPTQHFYLDPDTFLELKVTTEGPSASDTELSNYKSIDGIMVPHNIKIMQGGVVQAELKIQTVTFNTPMADTLFKVK